MKRFMFMLCFAFLTGCAGQAEVRPAKGLEMPEEDARLFLSVFKGDLDGVRSSIQAGADINARQKGLCSAMFMTDATPLYAAVASKHPNVVRFLLGRGADRKIPNWRGESPLDLAKRLNLQEIANLLEGESANPVSVVSDRELKPLPDMSDAKVATPEDAVKAVVQKVIADPNDGLPSTYGPAAELSFMLGFDVPGFGKRGDRVWQVHFTALTGQAARIAWVNAEDGNVMFLMEEKR